MNSKVLITLEYDKIIKLLADRATSEPGRKKCMELTPLSDHDGINRLQQETFDSTGRLLRNGDVSFGGNKAVEASMMRLEKGSSISTQELMDIAGLLENTARVRSYGHRGDEESKDCLDEMFDALSPLSGISSEIRRCIISCDEIADDASPELKNIRRHIRATQDRIHTRLNSMVNSIEVSPFSFL